MKQIWNIFGEQEESLHKEAEKTSKEFTYIYNTPDLILNEYANQLSVDTKQLFIGLVTQAVSEENNEATYALYIASPKLKNYMYRLIEVNTPNIFQPYPLEITLFAKDPKNHRTIPCDSAEEFRTQLEEFIKSPITKVILMHLKQMIEINKEDYKFNLSNENSEIKFEIKPNSQPFIITKVILKSHLGADANLSSSIIINSSLMIYSRNLSNNNTGDWEISLLQFIDIYQSRPILNMKLALPEYKFYSQNHNDQCEVKIKVVTPAEKYEFEIHYEAFEELQEIK